MWEGPQDLWRRLKLGREEFLQRLITTLIVGGDPPPWNVPRPPSEQGLKFLRLLDALAHGQGADHAGWPEPDVFVDEYLLPKLDESAPNGWPDWAVLWPSRAWVIELKTEPGSHRAGQLPYYLQLAAAAHPERSVDVTYVTGPLSKPAPPLGIGQRYGHVQWEQVLPLIEEVWGGAEDDRVAAYVGAVRTVIQNLGVMRPSGQRAALLGADPEASAIPTSVEPSGSSYVHEDVGVDRTPLVEASADLLLQLAQATAADGIQRGVGAASPSDLESLRDTARARIDALAADDATRFVLPWLWKADRTTGRALTAEGDEFGYELRFSRYKTVQIKP